MGNDTKIEWAHHTFNPVIGCTKVSPGCKNCYAEAYATRYKRTVWGPGAKRIVTSDANWEKPLAIQRKLERTGGRERIFCASLSDVFDPEWPAGVRERLFTLITKTPNIDWLLLTKRPEDIERLYGRPRTTHRDNVWLGITAENQEQLDKRLPEIARYPSKVTFVSYEPALGPLVLGDHAGEIDWVIAGGETGPDARTCELVWFEKLLRECKDEGIPFFMKQMGRCPTYERAPYQLRDPKGADPDSWPDGFNVREIPQETDR